MFKFTFHCWSAVVVVSALLSTGLGQWTSGQTFPVPPFMCNCNNPKTKATNVQDLCSAAGGKLVTGYFFGVDPVSQDMCVGDAELEHVFTSPSCQALYGAEFNAFCGSYNGVSDTPPPPWPTNYPFPYPYPGPYDPCAPMC
ncbi:hypothetical protein GE09DRAFT_1052759 [Coniochaeta sp. 2T2.1]|nr:hypothetical protein GE09DRAFT_1052759 [Coniochaeta sp. 2T2.1]